MQARAQATRDAIIGAAVELVNGVGYGDTGIVDILAKAGVTKGAFYYHFSTRESVASAIVAQGSERIRDIVAAILLDSESSALENLIRSSFAVAECLRTDELVQAGHHLRLTMPVGKAVDTAGFVSRRALFVDAVEAAKRQGDVLEDVDAVEVADTIRAAIVGISGIVAITDRTVFTYLAEVWRVVLRGIVGAESLPYFREYVSRISQLYLVAADQAR
ncbi:TetR family transcriptional regulator [Mycolicibacterium anyangense]|uniref:TetR family transcriptional regulator n=1 Tax=Mycolicibacterium anyangense TaxID=1431246 RepID=A0A6N4W4B7_9MYCO|nr:TetR/AcrR family transcriptional regulator [Mycolicibacterium anyangense]BBZ75213.1 TetR family transcriptional regulator [Mycolicibacterium anyangense]